MSVYWERIVEKYNYIFNDLSDPLTKNWLFVGSPFPILTILVTYNIFCLKIGPLLMKNRTPYELKTVIKLYNIFQVIISLYTAYEGYVYIFSGNFNFQCQGVRYKEERVARGIHVYLITKLIELLDTIFFVLRKSYRQITFLHLFHHTLMPIVSWIGLKYFPGGQAVILGAINSLVHVFMYFYYFLSGLGPQYKKYLWWKKYITVMQILQFLVIFWHSIYSLFYSCSYLLILKIMTIIFSAVFIYMFSKFYYMTYIARRHRSSVTQSKTEKNVTMRQYSKINENPVNCKDNDNSNGHYVNGALNSGSKVFKKRIRYLPKE